MRKKLVAGNWKMNTTQAQAKVLAKEVMAFSSDAVEVVLCPPFPYLSVVQKVLEDTNCALGAQDVSAFEKGAHTGQVSAEMLLDLGCGYVIVGHSERRQAGLEDNQIVAQKARRAQDSGLVPIVCVGESLETRQAGDMQSFIAEQLKAFSEVGGLEGMVIAYEPIWAIGTGQTATPEEAAEVHAFIRQTVAAEGLADPDTLSILYGGSLKPENAEALFAQKDIDGGLIGGAALKSSDFIKICQLRNA